jgi:hypothetical protein
MVDFSSTGLFYLDRPEGGLNSFVAIPGLISADLQRRKLKIRPFSTPNLFPVPTPKLR